MLPRSYAPYGETNVQLPEAKCQLVVWYGVSSVGHLPILTTFTSCTCIEPQGNSKKPSAAEELKAVKAREEHFRLQALGLKPATGPPPTRGLDRVRPKDALSLNNRRLNTITSGGFREFNQTWRNGSG